MRLSEPMVFTTSLLPICLPSPTSGGEIHFCWDLFCIEPFLPKASLPSANFSDRHLCRAQFLPRPFFDRVIYFEPHFCLAPFLLSVIFAERPSFGWEPFLLRAILPSTIVPLYSFLYSDKCSFHNQTSFANNSYRRKPFWQSAILAQSHVCREPFIFAASHLFLPRAIFCCASLALRDILCC